MTASFRICLSWLGGIVAALALICLLGLETSTASVANEIATFAAPLVQTQHVVAAEPDHAHRAGHRDSGHEHRDRKGGKSSCCTSAACSGPGMMSSGASLFVMTVTISCQAAPLDRLIPFEEMPSERPPRAA
jgi:hypothetical protein